MKFELNSVGGRWPDWVVASSKEYQKRYPAWLNFSERHVSLSPRSKSVTLQQSLQNDAAKQLKGIDSDWVVIGLERTGKKVSSEQIAMFLGQMREENNQVAMLIGSPEGLANECLDRADLLWSISDMVMAHPIVRVVMAEQIYRATSIMSGSPYHKGVSTHG